MLAECARPALAERQEYPTGLLPNGKRGAQLTAEAGVAHPRRHPGQCASLDHLAGAREIDRALRIGRGIRGLDEIPLDPGGSVLAHEIVEQGGRSVDRAEITRLGRYQAPHASRELDAKGCGIESRVTGAPNAAVRLALSGGVSCAHRFRHTASPPPRNVESLPRAGADHHVGIMYRPPRGATWTRRARVAMFSPAGYQSRPMVLREPSRRP